MENTPRYERNSTEKVTEACRLLFKHRTKSARTLLLMSIKTVKERTRKQHMRRREDRDVNYKKNNKYNMTYGQGPNGAQTRKRQFFYKQLADVIESVTGAATIACGLNLT